jgi:hypothetical protein
VRLNFISDLRGFSCNLTCYLRVIEQMWLTFFLSHDKWYQINLITPCDAKTLHDMGFKEDAWI